MPAGPYSYKILAWIGISLPIFLVEGFFNLLTNVDIIIVGQFVPPDQVAVYYAATKTLALVHFVYFSVRAGAAMELTWAGRGRPLKPAAPLLRFYLRHRDGYPQEAGLCVATGSR